MHTKEEITKKRGKSADQLNLNTESSSADKLKHKRRWIYFALLITTGLSLFFWLYRSFRSVAFHPKLPQISFNSNRPVSGNLTLTSQLSAILSSHPDITGFYLSHDRPSENVSYGITTGLDPDALKTALTSLPQIIKSPNTALLPQGVTYREIINSSAGQTIFSSLITNPIDKIFIIIRYKDSSDSIKSIFPELISAAYWMVSSN